MLKLFAAVIFTVCPAGEEPVKVGDTIVCQPTSPLNFNLKNDRDGFPEPRCPGKDCPDNAQP